MKYILKLEPLDHWKKHKEHKNYCSRSHKKEHKTFFCNPKLTTVTDNKRFWKKYNHFFSKIVRFLIKTKIAIQNVIKTLNITENSYLTNTITEILNPAAIFKHKNHSSI